MECTKSHLLPILQYFLNFGVGHGASCGAAVMLRCFIFFLRSVYLNYPGGGQPRHIAGVPLRGYPRLEIHHNGYNKHHVRCDRLYSALEYEYTSDINEID